MSPVIKLTAAQLSAFISAIILSPITAYAQTTLLGQQLNSLIDTFNGLILLLLLIAIVVFSWGVVKLIAAAGSPEQIRKAKGILWWGIIGIAVMASIMGIINFLQMAFGISGTGIINVPQFFRR
ncbi:MAG: hypothetical protein AAB539_03935 [Patescibacteria group bacterium]